MEEALQEVDALYRQRVNEQRLLDSIQLAEKLEIEYPTDPGVQWRISRGLTALAYGYAPVDSEAVFMEAIGWGRECLRANPGWAAREYLSGGRVTRRATLRLVESDLPCLETLLVGWTRWVVHRGPAAYVDLSSLEVLAARAVQLDQAEPGWVAPWALGMALGLSSSGGESLAEAMGLLEVAAGRETELATPRIDGMYLLLARGGDPAVAEMNLDQEQPTHATHPWSLENRRGVQRELQLRDREQPGAF